MCVPTSQPGERQQEAQGEKHVGGHQSAGERTLEDTQLDVLDRTESHSHIQRATVFQTNKKDV